MHLRVDNSSVHSPATLAAFDAISEFNPEGVIRSPDHSARSGARLNASDAQFELVRDCSHPHASKSCSIIRKVAYDTRALEMSVHVVDRRG
jgi:hypothetical protein